MLLHVIGYTSSPIMPRLHQRNLLRGAQLDACCGYVAGNKQLAARNMMLVARIKLRVARNKLRWCKRGIIYNRV